MNEIKKHHPRKMYPHSLSPHFPSNNCRQHLSVDELEQKTQNSRIIRHKRMLEHKYSG